jgi:hypothetical protein
MHARVGAGRTGALPGNATAQVSMPGPRGAHKAHLRRKHGVPPRRLHRLRRGEAAVPAARPGLAPTPAAEELAACCGEFEARPGAAYELRVLGGELWFADSMLLAISADRFWHQPWHCEVAGAEGRAAQLGTRCRQTCWSGASSGSPRS